MANVINSRQKQIVEAATAVFLRYGFGRTTMSDIAKASGLTRPTLYLTFPDKETVFHAVVETMIADKLEQIRTGIADLTTLHERLLYACNSWAAEGYELVQNHPDASDMFDLGFKSVCEGYQAMENVIAGIVSDALSRTPLDLSAEELARSIVLSLKGYKDTAIHGEDLRRLIATHVMMVSKALVI